MVSFNQGNTQVYSPFGTLVVEQHVRGYHDPRHPVPREPEVPAGARPAKPKCDNCCCAAAKAA